MRVLKFWLAVFGFLFLGIATLVVYLSIYFSASQPDNYGAIRFKVYAWLCIIAAPVEIIGFFWTVSRIYSRRTGDGMGNDKGKEENKRPVES